MSSPLGRCRETSEIVATALGHAHADIEYDSRLKEISFGSWEGRTLSDVQLKEPDVYRRRKENRWDISPPEEKATPWLHSDCNPGCQNSRVHRH